MDSYNPSKRSRDDYEDGNSGQNSGGYEDNKRQTVDPTTELIANVCKDIRRIGENSNIVTQVEDISYISNPIVAEFEKIDKLRIAILDNLFAVVIEQPQKITSLSVLILLCNPKNFIVAKYVIEFFHSKAQGLIDLIEAQGGVPDKAGSVVAGIQKQQEQQEFAGLFNNLKSILKFLACLSPIIENFAIVDLFKQFLNLSFDLQAASDAEGKSRNGIAEEIYYNTLIALPYLLSNDFGGDMKSKCDELVELAGRAKYHTETRESALFSPFYGKGSNFADDMPYKPKDIISLIYPAILEIQRDNWSGFQDKLFIDFKSLTDPLVAKSLENNQLSKELVKHQLPPLSLPLVSKINEYFNQKEDDHKSNSLGLIDSLWLKNPRILFQVYNITTEFETVPPIESYIGLFFKDLNFDILTNLSFNKNEASIQLSILDLYFNKKLFAPPGSSIDQLSHVHADNKALTTNEEPLSTWKIEDVAIESILTMIFQLPLPLHVEVYYYSVLISCCRELPESIAPVFGRAIRFLYNNLETLDYELKIRFLDWMTIQISNFDFSWKWDEWVKDSTMLQNLKFHPKKNFIKNLIAKEIRLSNKNKIKDSFVTIDSTTGDIVKLDTFYQYLTLSLVDNEESYVVDYDSSLYGGSEKVREIFQTLANQRREKKEQQQQEHPNALIVSPQEELIYNFSLPTVPLNEIANSVYDFVVANWKSNSDFQDLCKSVYLAIEKKQSTEEKKEHDEDNIEDEKKEEKEKEDEPMVEKVDENGILDGINKDKYLVNLIIQTYVYIGSRSIYSAVSVFSRDIVKLRYLAGWEEEKSEEPKEGEFQFEPLNLTTEQFNERQQWIIESIFRVWNHQPQVAFLILEYLIEFKILKPISLLENVFETGKNLIIENVSCMESINRVLTKVEDTDDAVLSKIFELIVINLNSVLEKLETANDSGIIIEKKREEFTESEIEDKDLMRNIDNQWLYYEYLGLLKSYIRKFKISNIKEILERINSTIVRDEALAWVEELKKLE